MQLPMPPADKLGHAFAGAVIFALVGAVAAFAGFGEWSRMTGAAAAALAGIAKEASDYRLNRAAVARGEMPPHGVEFADFAATFLGALFVWGAAILTGA